MHEALEAWLAKETKKDGVAPDSVKTHKLTELPVFQCPPGNVQFHEQLERILSDPEERGAIVANLKWGSHAVEAKRKMKKA